MQIQMKSKNGFFLVPELPQEFNAETRRNFEEYMNTVVDFLPIIDETLGYERTITKLCIDFINEKPLCDALNGIIYLELKDEYMSEIYGGLFHETIHCLIRRFKHRSKGDNFFPEPFTNILQVATLENMSEYTGAQEKANDIIDGVVLNSNNQALFNELIRIYTDNDRFETMKPVYEAMINSDKAIFTKENIITEINRIFSNIGVTELIPDRTVIE